MNSFAPVLIPTLCRYNHFKRCIESLSACTHAEKTDLYIALDYPLNKSHWEGYNKINRYLEKVEGFKTVTVVKRDKNFGVFENFKEARREIFNINDRFILSEDDNYYSPNFLDYINKGLDKFKDDPNVFAICGYNFPIEMPQSYVSNIYVWKGFNAWGCGIWREKINKVKYTLNDVDDFLSDPRNILKLNKYAGHYFFHLLNVMKTRNITDDTLFCMNIVKNNMVCVFPVVSKVRNYGHDGTGEHGGSIESDIYSSQLIDSANTFNFEMSNKEIDESKEINILLRKHFGQSKLSRFFIFFKYILFKFRLLYR